IYDVLLGNVDAKDTIISIKKDLDIIPANNDMSFIEFDILPHFKKFDNPFYLLKNSISPIISDYDYIFIYSPPAMGLVVRNALVASTDVIIPYVPEVFAVNGLIRIYKAIKDFTHSHNNNLNIIGIVGMMVDSRTTLHQTMLQQARVHCFQN